MNTIPEQPVAAALDALVDHLDRGGLAVLPTDTVYGLGCRAADSAALVEMRRRKTRERSVPIAVLVADAEQAAGLWSDPSPGRTRLIERFWPGPLTLVDGRRADLQWDLGGDETSIGVRCPDRALLRAVAARVGPLAVTSANRSGDPPLTSVAGAHEALGDGLVVIDGGVRAGQPSAVVSVRGGLEILRPGPLSETELRECWDPPTMSDVEGE